MKPETHVTYVKDPIDKEIDAKCDTHPRCSHCGFGKVKVRESLCTECVQKLVRGLAYLTKGGPNGRH